MQVRVHISKNLLNFIFTIFFRYKMKVLAFILLGLSLCLEKCSGQSFPFRNRIFTTNQYSSQVKTNKIMNKIPNVKCLHYYVTGPLVPRVNFKWLKSVHFKKTVAWFSFLSKLWYISVQIKTKSITVLKEMRTAKLSS